MTAKDTHHVELEVGGDELPLFKSLLNRIELTEEITRVRVEIESTAPILSECETAGQGTDESTEESEGTEADQKLIRSRHEGPIADSADERDTAADGSGEPSSFSQGVAQRLEDLNGSVDTGENAVQYLVDTQPQRPYEEHPAPEEFQEWTEVELKEDTNRFRVMAVLYRCKNYLKTGQVHSLMEGTSWETPYKSTSATLSKAKSNGLIQKHEKYGGYQLTQLGRDLMRGYLKEADGYPLKTADNIRERASPEQKQEPSQNFVTA